MNNFAVLPSIKDFRFPRVIISYAVWMYYRFNLSTADVEDLLTERGITVSREAIRLWVNRFGRHYADCITQIALGEIVRGRTTSGIWTKS